MSAGLAMLNYLKSNPSVYTQLQGTTDRIVKGMKANLNKLGLNFQINQMGSMFTLFFTSEPVVDFNSAKKSDTQLFGKYFHAMLEKGVYLAPSQYEALFISAAITDQLSDEIVKANYESLEQVLQLQ
jgi:glutamate-1-semialdehyde 2,1-aminomutase